jgi:hypothetical protein
MVKLIGLFAAVGLIIPIVFTAFWKLLENYKSLYVSIGNKALIIQLLVWPSVSWMWAVEAVGLEGDEYYTVLLLSIAANTMLYAVIGFLVWWGMHRHRWILYVLIGLIIIGWYTLLIPR